MMMPVPVASLLTGLFRPNGYYTRASEDREAQLERITKAHRMRGIIMADAIKRAEKLERKLAAAEKALSVMCQTSANYQRLWADSELAMLDSFDERIREAAKTCPPEARATLTEILICNDHERQRIMEDDRRNH